MTDHQPSDDTDDESPSSQAIIDRVGEQADPDRSDAARAFAEAALRRVPDAHLERADIDIAADALLGGFGLLDGCDGDRIQVRVTPNGPSIVGRSGTGTIIETGAEDRPFLLSTVTAEIDLQGFDLRRMVHPILGVERGDDGRIAKIAHARDAQRRESYIRAEIEQVLDDEQAASLERGIKGLLTDVMRATSDFLALRGRLQESISQLDALPAGAFPRGDIDEAMALLGWFLDDNFLLLGWREYAVVDVDGTRCLQAVASSGLGILRDADQSRYAQPVPLDGLPIETRSRFEDGPLITVTRSNLRSTVRQRERMDVVGIRVVDADGNVTGEKRLLGMFTRKGLSEPAKATPILRRRLEVVLEREDIVKASHDERMLVTLFNALPKDELFQSSIDQLQSTLMGLLQAEERRDTRTLVRVEHSTKTVSIIVAVPRDNYGPALRENLTELFRDRFNGERVDVDLSLGERAEAIARFSVEVLGEIPDVDTAELSQAVADLARSWTQDMVAMFVADHGEVEGTRLGRLAAGMPRAYQDATPVTIAADDIRRIDRLVQGATGGLDVMFVAPADGMTRLRVTKSGPRLELSAFLPIVESIGLTVVEEVPHRSDELDLTLHDFGVRDARSAMDLDEAGPRLADAILAAWRGQLELDELNRLVADAQLTWRQVNILRAYRRYRRQAGTVHTPQYVNETVADHPEVARAIIDYFEAKFAPEDPVADARAHEARSGQLEEHRARCLRAIDKVARLDQDRILRGLVALVDATLRTNQWCKDSMAEQADGSMVGYLALKFDSARVPDVPQPVPYREIFVYSPAVEGIHLRGGPVARGGLRWSDRRDDYRTEVLGLMKAQISKNAVIVPTGAKGGFVLKRPPVDRDQLREEVERQYKTFVRALLDVTDNIVAGEIVPPPDVVRHDTDDPYLVVAADKGTATFSDTANGIAEERGFWLGDAFASGGSHGYDHKKLGITARGAWVAVRQHFTELGVDIQTEPITVVGIGDMSGDVFGNGMLLSRAIKLVAAFDHRDIFLDPSPDPEVAHAERERLFALPRSSWQDYDTSKLSEGGGIHSRDLKSIPLSPQIREVLRIDAEELSPPALMQAILKAPADLFWAGGIGTYVKSSSETHDDAGDRSNDEIRIDADQLRVRVIGEGANLSITQAGRIQYARRGGRLNMDAIDNVAGVDSSDHEVNVKIFLRLAVEAGRITGDERDDLLEAVTEDVVEHVLRDVKLQAQRLSLELAQAPTAMHAYERLMVELEDQGMLLRSVEFLPDTATMSERAGMGAGLTRPELAVLLAYAKREIKLRILASSLPDDPSLHGVLGTYFPERLVQQFGDLLPQHRLHRELVATIVANDLVNRMGVTFAFQTSRSSGKPVAEVTAAYWAAREVAHAEERHEQIEALAGQIPAERSVDLSFRVSGLVAELTRAYLETAGPVDIAAIVQRDEALLQSLSDDLPSLGTQSQRMARNEQASMLIDDLVDADLARFLASSGDLSMTPAIAAVAGDRAGVAVADAFLWMDHALGVHRLLELLRRAPVHGRWDREQRLGLDRDLTNLRTLAVRTALAAHPDADEATSVRLFLEERRDRLAEAMRPVNELEAASEVPLDALAVLARALHRVVTSD